MKTLVYILLLSITVIFTSCETDIDVNADYEDITIVYGAINPKDTVHYVKINKAFLGEGNAYDLAASESNFNYSSDELKVYIEEYDGEVKKNETLLIRTVNEFPKESGIFDNSTNVLYKYMNSSIDRDNTYKIRIINESLNKEITGQTEIVKSLAVTDPATTQKIQFYNGVGATGVFADRTIAISTGADIGRVQAILNFNYINHFTIASGKPQEEHTVTMVLGETKTTTSSGGESIAWKLEGETFFDNISSAVPATSTFPLLSHRELQNITITFNIAGTELSTYMDVSAPSTSINQDKPDYTNLTNAIGIFSSRELRLWQPSMPVGIINIHDHTIKQLETLNLGFCFGSGTAAVPCNQI